MRGAADALALLERLLLLAPADGDLLLQRARVTSWDDRWSESHDLLARAARVSTGPRRHQHPAHTLARAGTNTQHPSSYSTHRHRAIHNAAAGTGAAWPHFVAFLGVARE